MKRFVLLASLIVVLGGIFGYLLANKSSYVLLVYEQQAFETSLWFFSLMLLAVFFLLNRSLPLISRSIHPRKYFHQWSLQRRIAASKRDFFQGLMDFETGAWDKALKKFQAAAMSLDRPIVAYLYAARAAHHLGRKDIKEAMLHEAAQSEPKSALAVGLVRAEILIEEENLVDAKAILEGLKQATPSQHRVLELLKTIESA